METEIIEYLEYLGYRNIPNYAQEFLQKYITTKTYFFELTGDFATFFAITEKNSYGSYYCYVIYCRNIEDLYNRFNETPSLKCKTIDEVKNLLNMTI
jgi:hypothetical protein